LLQFQCTAANVVSSKSINVTVLGDYAENKDESTGGASTGVIIIIIVVAILAVIGVLVAFYVISKYSLI